MFAYETGYYEYNYRTLKEAQEAKKQLIKQYTKTEKRVGGYYGYFWKRNKMMIYLESEVWFYETYCNR